MSLLTDAQLRKAILVGMLCILGGCLISQAMMQLGGGPRDEPMDLSSQLPEGAPNDGMVFPDGMPPFISSGGVFYPEKAVFDIGLGITGLLFMLLAVEIFLRTKDANQNAHWARKIAMWAQPVVGLGTGFSLVMLTRHPFDVSLVKHILYATAIFWGGQVWIFLFAISRNHLDVGIMWRGRSVGFWRWVAFGASVLSFQLMTAFIAADMLVKSAIFEWTLTFAFEAAVLTLIPILEDKH